MQFHVKIDAQGTSQVYLIEATNSRDALGQGISFASGSYDVITVYDGPPENEVVLEMSMDSAPLPPVHVDLPPPNPSPSTSPVESTPENEVEDPESTPENEEYANDKTESTKDYLDRIRNDTVYPNARRVLGFFKFLLIFQLLIALAAACYLLSKAETRLQGFGALLALGLFIFGFAIIEAGHCLFDIADATLDKNRK